MKFAVASRSKLLPLVLILIVGLAFVGYRVATHNPACGRPGSQTDMRKDPPYRDYVKGWTDLAGCRVRRDVIALRQNSCTREDIREILFGTPLGDPTTPGTTQIYVHDPRGQYGEGPLRLNVSLPTGARDAGYRFGNWQLWTVPGHATFVFVVTSGRVEAWPRGHGPSCL
jgi:hypothetical protein